MVGRVGLALAIALVSRVGGAAMASAKSVGENLFRLPYGGELLDESLFVSRVQSQFYFSLLKSHVV
jgi:hypothetical protein